MEARAGHRSAAGEALSGAAGLEADDDLHHHQAAGRARDPENENGLVTALVSRDEAQACEIDELVEKKFEGSLPTFIAAFTRRQDLSDRELDEVQQMIDRIRRGETR